MRGEKRNREIQKSEPDGGRKGKREEWKHRRGVFEGVEKEFKPRERREFKSDDKREFKPREYRKPADGEWKPKREFDREREFNKERKPGEFRKRNNERNND